MIKIARIALDALLCGLIGFTAHIVRIIAALIVLACYCVVKVAAWVYHHALEVDVYEQLRLQEYGARTYDLLFKREGRDER